MRARVETSLGRPFFLVSVNTTVMVRSELDRNTQVVTWLVVLIYHNLIIRTLQHRLMSTRSNVSEILLKKKKKDT